MHGMLNIAEAVPPLAEKDPAGVFASFVSGAEYGNLPPEVVQLYKLTLLDILTSLVGGVQGEAVTKVRGYFGAIGGKPEARVVGYGDRLPLLSSAFINSVACRALDLGDVEVEAGHGNEFIVPAMLSAADASDQVDGRTFITAFAVASEVVARIGHACYGWTMGYNRPHEIPVKMQPIFQWGVICGVARLLGFDNEQTWDAIGHGYGTLSTTDTQSTVEGTYMKCLQHGFAARNGIHCCQLAKDGFRGTRNVFYGIRGFIANFYPFENDPTLLTEGLGEKWVAQFYRKKFAACLLTHSSIQAAMDIVSEHTIAVENIVKIVAEVSPANPVVGPGKHCPKTAGEAKFSLPYTVATALIKGKVFVDDFSEEQLQRDDVCSLMAKIKTVIDERMQSALSGRVTIITNDERSFTKEMLEPPGSPQAPLRWDDIVSKFYSVVDILRIPISKENQKKIVSMVENIEQVENMKSLLDLLMWG